MNSLKDLVVRTETNKLVTDLVNLDRVRCLLKTIFCRRQFLAYRERLRQQGTSRFCLAFPLLIPSVSKEIPSIVVDGLSEGSPRSPGLSVNNGYDASIYGSRPGSPTPDRRFGTPDVSLALDSIPKLQRSSRRASDISMLSTDLGSASQFVYLSGIGLLVLIFTNRRNSMVEAEPQNVLSSMQNSMWGGMYFVYHSVGAAY